MTHNGKQDKHSYPPPFDALGRSISTYSKLRKPFYNEKCESSAHMASGRVGHDENAIPVTGFGASPHSALHGNSAGGPAVIRGYEGALDGDVVDDDYLMVSRPVSETSVSNSNETNPTDVPTGPVNRARAGPPAIPLKPNLKGKGTASGSKVYKSVSFPEENEPAGGPTTANPLFPGPLTDESLRLNDIIHGIEYRSRFTGNGHHMVLDYLFNDKGSRTPINGVWYLHGVPISASNNNRSISVQPGTGKSMHSEDAAAGFCPVSGPTDAEVNLACAGRWADVPAVYATDLDLDG